MTIPPDEHIRSSGQRAWHLADCSRVDARLHMRDVKRRRSTMTQCTILNLCAVTALGLALLPDSAASQQRSIKEHLAGSWTIVSNDNVAPDGTKRQIFGANPNGLFILAADGRYALVVVNPARPKFKGSSRLDGTPEENKAAIAGTVAAFGTWSFDEATSTLVTSIEGSRIGRRRTQNAQSISGFGRTSRNRFQTCEVERAMSA
jgi:hypothetical protein